MLVLEREKDEVIRIGAEIRVTIVAIRGDQVKVGIDAPPEIPVHRQEIFAAIERGDGTE